jgi:RNA polymerase sigma-70 factor (ECF subfamily)
VDERLPSRSQQQTLRLLGDNELSQLVERYVAAWERNDVEAVVAMLAEDARIAMPPLPSWYSGRAQVAAFLRAYALAGVKRWQLVRTSANGQPALAEYLWDERTATFMPHGLMVLTLREGQIEEITAFLSPDAFPRFDLPASIPA